MLLHEDVASTAPDGGATPLTFEGAQEQRVSENPIFRQGQHAPVIGARDDFDMGIELSIKQPAGEQKQLQQEENGGMGNSRASVSKRRSAAPSSEFVFGEAENE
jgi:hypothetical protein